jgi:hypothetical protein
MYTSSRVPYADNALLLDLSQEVQQRYHDLGFSVGKNGGQSCSETRDLADRLT